MLGDGTSLVSSRGPLLSMSQGEKDAATNCDTMTSLLRILDVTMLPAVQQHVPACCPPVDDGVLMYTRDDVTHVDP